MLAYLPYILYVAIQIFRIRMMRIHFVIFVNKRNVERFELLGNIYFFYILIWLSNQQMCERIQKNLTTYNYVSSSFDQSITFRVTKKNNLIYI